MILKEISHNEFDGIFAEMEKNFIPDERRDRDAAKKLLDKREYKIYHTVNEGERVGFITVWELSDFTFIEHFVTYETYRNKGYGAKVISALKEKYERLLLEAEPPVSEMQKRRVAFYERNGFVQNPQKYMQPAYRSDGSEVELVLMSYPCKLECYADTVREIYGKVYNKRRQI